MSPTRKPAAKRAMPGKAPPTKDRKLAAAQLARVRKLCASLPDTGERDSHGSPGFFTSGKLFAYFLDNHHNDGRLALWCAAPEGAQLMLIDSNPEVYFFPPYVGKSGWIGVRLDRDAAWPEIAAVLEAAHQVRYKPPKPRRVSKR